MPKLSFAIFRRLLRPRLSLRAMMLAVLIFGGGFGWYIASARRQAETVAMIDRAGGVIAYDWQYRKGEWFVFEPPYPEGPPYPDWLLDCLGHDFFCNVTRVSLDTRTMESYWLVDPDLPPGTPGWPRNDGALARRVGEFRHLEVLDAHGNKEFNDDFLSRFSGLGQIRTLDLGDTSVTGAELVHLKSMAKLEDLNLDGLPIRDGDLASLSGLTSLKTLCLPGEHLTDAGLAHLGTLTNLEELRIDAKGHPSAVTTKGLAYLTNLRSLESLEIKGSRIDSLETIRPLARLQQIRLVDAALSDEGLTPLPGFSALVVLQLDGNPKITDASLASLASMGEPRRVPPGEPPLILLDWYPEIFLRGTKVTRAGIAALEARIPHLRVHE